MLCCMTSKFIIRPGQSRVDSSFFDCDDPTKHFKFGEIGRCFRLKSQAGIQIQTVNTVSQRCSTRLRDFRQVNACHC